MSSFLSWLIFQYFQNKWLQQLNKKFLPLSFKLNLVIGKLFHIKKMSGVEVYYNTLNHFYSNKPLILYTD